MIKYVQTAQWFGAAAMQREVALLEEKAWMQHYNKKHYEGNWSVMPLRSVQGSMEGQQIITRIRTYYRTVRTYNP